MLPVVLLVVDRMAGMVKAALFPAALRSGELAMVVITITRNLTMQAPFTTLKPGGLGRCQTAVSNAMRDPFLLPMQAGTHAVGMVVIRVGLRGNGQD